MDPPDQAVVLSTDGKTRIQAPERTRKGLPMKPGRSATMTRDCERHRHEEPIELNNMKAANAYSCTANPERLIAARLRGCRLTESAHLDR